MVIRLDTIDKVKEFVNDACAVSDEMDITDGHYIVNAKSILGIFSLNLCKDLELVCSRDAERYFEEYRKS